MEDLKNLGTAAPAASAGQSGSVDAPIKSLNAVPTAGAGQSAVADGQTAAAPAASAAAEQAKPAQTREENAAFARMRRELEKSQAALDRYKSMGAVVQRESGLHSDDPDDIRRELLARREGVTADTIRQREEQEAQRYKEQMQRDPQYLAAQNELSFYRQQAASAQRQQDLAELKAKYPADNIDESTLGEQYAKLRSAGVDNLHAYAAIRDVAAAEEAGKKPTPPDTGAVGQAPDPEIEYYTPEEVDKLTTKQLDDPQIMEKVMKSMTKWKK